MDNIWDARAVIFGGRSGGAEAHFYFIFFGFADPKLKLRSAPSKKVVRFDHFIYE